MSLQKTKQHRELAKLRPRRFALDDQLAEAHASMALIAQNYDWDWRKAESEYKRAIDL